MTNTVRCSHPGSRYWGREGLQHLLLYVSAIPSLAITHPTPPLHPGDYFAYTNAVITIQVGAAFTLSTCHMLRCCSVCACVCECMCVCVTVCVLCPSVCDTGVCHFVPARCISWVRPLPPLPSPAVHTRSSAPPRRPCTPIGLRPPCAHTHVLLLAAPLEGVAEKAQGHGQVAAEATRRLRPTQAPAIQEVRGGAAACVWGAGSCCWPCW